MITSYETAAPVSAQALPVEVRETIHELVRLLPVDTSFETFTNEDGWTIVALGPTGRELERREVYL